MSKVSSLEDSVQKVPLIGPKYAEKLSKIGVSTVRDLLFHIPFRYKDTSEVITIEELKNEGAGMILAAVDSVSTRRAGRYLIVQASLSDETGTVNAVWFNQPYITKSLKKGGFFMFEGKMRTKKGYSSLSSPAFEKYEEKGKDNQVHLGRITPYYESTAGMSSKWIRSRLNFLKKEIIDLVEDPLPDDLCKKFNLESLPVAIFKIHFPESWEDIESARKRLAFDEFLRLGLKIEKKKLAILRREAPRIVEDGYENKLQDFLKSLKFTLTLDQERAVTDILTDLSKFSPMNRLLNGDVGSGKTIVAVIACYLTVLSGHDALVMAPTTILARQHFSKFSDYLEKFGIKIQLLTSGEILEPTSENEIIIGTHALLHEEFLPEDVGLVVVDEQHRFGVLQREHLLNNKINNGGDDTFSQESVDFQDDKGGRKDDLENDSRADLKMPHYLSMTATPIPRTLTHVLYGDSSVSQIKMMPPGRIPVETHYVPKKKRGNCLKWVADYIYDSKKDSGKADNKAGNVNPPQQAFIIFPLVEESEKIDLKSAVKQFDTLSKGVFKKLNVALVHGRIKQEEKDEILREFKDGKYDVLISTSVVEVGIDIPNATIMVIDDADRFGLAQLHQFRGRVGRNMMQAYCYVIASNNLEKGSQAEERLKYFSSHNSGFEVAEFDLESRGPGEVYGLAQSGIPDLKAADITDIDSLLLAREAAAGLLRTLSGGEIHHLEKGLFS